MQQMNPPARLWSDFQGKLSRLTAKKTPFPEGRNFAKKSYFFNLEIADFLEKMGVEISKWYQKSLETSEIKFLGQVVIA